MLRTLHRWKLGLLLIPFSMAGLVSTVLVMMALQAGIKSLQAEADRLDVQVEESLKDRDLPLIKANNDRLEEVVQRMRSYTAYVFATALFGLIMLMIFVGGTVLITSQPIHFWEKACRWSLVIIPVFLLASAAGVEPLLLKTCSKLASYAIGAGHQLALMKIAGYLREYGIHDRVVRIYRVYTYSIAMLFISLLFMNAGGNAPAWAGPLFIVLVVAVVGWMLVMTTISQLQLHFRLKRLLRVGSDLDSLHELDDFSRAYQPDREA
ncbi:MAG: hypothetical protein C0478_14060 [Planctomyces sp.]|nr:hypothetical protein [Planctomyces sp.]